MSTAPVFCRDTSQSISARCCSSQRPVTATARGRGISSAPGVRISFFKQGPVERPARRAQVDGQVDAWLIRAETGQSGVLEREEFRSASAKARA